MSKVIDQHLGKKSIMILKGCGGVDLFFKVICIMAFLEKGTSIRAFFAHIHKVWL